MARATTPTRRPALGTTSGFSSPSARPLFARRVTLSGGAGGAGVCSSRPHATTISDLPSVPPAAVVVRGRAKRACSCSPTTHPGSFRCALHRGRGAAAPGTSSGLHDVGAARRSAMANSLVRIAAVEGGDHVRRALAALVRPSSQHQRRRADFRPLPSRLSAMSTAGVSCSPPQLLSPL